MTDCVGFLARHRAKGVLGASEGRRKGSGEQVAAAVQLASATRQQLAM
jgi:hypothetical protein